MFAEHRFGLPELSDNSTKSLTLFFFEKGLTKYRTNDIINLTNEREVNKNDKGNND